MKIPLLITCLVIIHLSALSQIATISDANSGQPIEMATISSENPRAFVTTNANGQADIQLFKGSTMIEIRMLGYKVEQKSFSEMEELAFKIRMTSSGISLDELVISATRWNQSTKDVPAKITSISARSVSMQNPQTAADMLSTSGEVFIQKSQQGGGSPMIRGFSTNRLLYTVDGVRMNTAIFRSGNLQNVISLDPFATENTEVLFGPGSVIYGSDAIGGVMNFRTLTPKFSFSDTISIAGRATIRAATANEEKTGHVHINIGWKKWSLITSYSHFNFGDLKMGRHGPDDYKRLFYVKRLDSLDVVVTNNDPLVQKPTAYSQNNLMQKISFKPGDEWQFDYGFHYSETSNYDRYDRHIRLMQNLPQSGEWYYGPQIWMMNNMAATHSKKNLLYDQLTIRLAHQFFKESRIDRHFNDVVRRMRTEEVDAYSANFDFNKFIGKRHKLFYGLEGVFNDVTSIGTNENISSNEVVDGPSRYPRSKWSSYAAYLNYQFRISQKILIQSGARYNRYLLVATFDSTFFPFPFTKTNINDGAITGSLGFVYNPSIKWVMSLNASTGFRSPNVDDMGKVFDSSPGTVVIPNPDLKAENAYNVELGIAKVFGDFLKLDLTGFYTILDDAMVRRDYQLAGLDSIDYNGELSRVQAIQNAASAYVYGIQAGFELKLYYGFGLSSRFNFQKGEEELDDGSKSPLRHAAPWFGVTHITYNIERLSLDLYLIKNGEVNYKNLPEEGRDTEYLFAKNIDGNPYSPKWYTLNLKMMYHITDNLSVSGGVENITDQRYRPYSSAIAGAGRNIIFAFSCRF